MTTKFLLNLCIFFEALIVIMYSSGFTEPNKTIGFIQAIIVLLAVWGMTKEITSG
jgi:hypothetical protein